MAPMDLEPDIYDVTIRKIIDTMFHDPETDLESTPKQSGIWIDLE